MQCRVCMQSKCQILFEMNILGTDDGKNLYECFNECTQLDASAKDHLPKTLCKLCAQKLQIAYNFRRNARQSNEEFKKLLISQKLETDSVDSSPEELCALEDTEESTDDPLDMSFHEALKALKKPSEELTTEEFCLEEDPDQSLEERLMEFPMEKSCLEEAPNRLEESLVEFPTEQFCLKKSPNRSLEEGLIEFPTEKSNLEVAANRPLEEDLMEFSTEKSCLEVVPSPSSEEHFKELPTEKSCLEESSNQSYEETHIEIVRESTPVDNTALHDNDEQSQVIMENEIETRNSFRQDEYESETEPVKKVDYDCEICSSTYTNKNELEKHISQQHKSEVICLSCPKVFDMPIELRIHNQLVHGTDSPVQCNFCSEKPLLPRNELVKHFQTTHNSRYYWYFPHVQKRHANDTEVRSAIKYTCKYCQKIFTTVIDLTEHIRSHLFKCPFCLKNFHRMRTYYLHVKRLHNSSASQFPAIPLAGDSKDKPIRCKACNKSYTNLASYNKHLKEKHNKGTRSKAKQKTTEYEAKEASIAEDEDRDTTTDATIAEGEAFENEDEDAVQALNKSVKKEQRKKKNVPQIKEKKRFLCSYCPRVLCSNVSLASHERSQHLNSKTDIKECPICQKKLKSDYIRNHIKIVHIGERNNICDICGGAYKSPSQLKRHKLLHMPDRHLPCSVCDRKFTETSALKVHMRSHTGELPYACHLCDRQFRIRVHLTYHLEHHANIKKICKVCGKEFKDGTTLRRHSFEHNGKMPYRCTACHYQTAKREYITTHMLRKHDIQITDEELYLMFKTNTGKSPRVKNVEYLKKLTENLQTSDNSN